MSNFTQFNHYVYANKADAEKVATAIRRDQASRHAERVNRARTEEEYKRLKASKPSRVRIKGIHMGADTAFDLSSGRPLVDAGVAEQRGGYIYTKSAGTRYVIEIDYSGNARGQSGKSLGRSLSHGFHVVSDKEAGRLAKHLGKKLPAHGRELRVELENGSLAWLTRTPDKHSTGSPKRGWSWALHGITPKGKAGLSQGKAGPP